MTEEIFKKAVYGLAIFNATLTKGYGKEWTKADYEGYSYKNSELTRLITVAKENNFPVFYNRITNVIYFMFGEIQISFHSGTRLRDSLLCHTDIEWDGIKNAYKYSEAEYIRLREERKEELQKRIAKLAIKESELISFAKNYIDILYKKLYRSRSEKKKNSLNKEIKSLADKSAYGLYEYFRFFEESKEICSELDYMYYDSYINCYSV